MAQSVLHRFTAELVRLERTVKRIDSLNRRNQLPRRDTEFAYAAALLAAFVAFERALEGQFVALLTREVQVDGRDVGIVHAQGNRDARRVIYAGRSYADWLPYERHTLPRARALLAEGKPFTRLTKVQQRDLEVLSVVRNAIAHSSPYALRKFRETALAGKSLPPRQRTVGGYLRSQFSAAPPQTVFQSHLLQLQTLVAVICA